MIDLEKYKRSLGSVAESMTDEQIEKLRAMHDQIADLVFDIWLKKRNDFKGSEGDLTKDGVSGTLSV